MIDSQTAANLYASTAQTKALGDGKTIDRAASHPAVSFGDAVRDAIQDVSASQKNAEVISAQAIAGKANLTDVVMAINEADMALEKVVAFRDRIVGAYNKIMNMSI